MFRIFPILDEKTFLSLRYVSKAFKKLVDEFLKKRELSGGLVSLVVPIDGIRRLPAEGSPVAQQFVVDVGRMRFETEWDQLARMISRSPNARGLVVTDQSNASHDTRAVAASSLPRVLQELRALERLSAPCQLTLTAGGGGGVVVSAVGKLQKLTALEVTGPGSLYGAQCHSLASGIIAQLPKLKSIELRNLEFAEGADGVFASIESHCGQLESLHVDRLSSASDDTSLAAALRRATKLTALGVWADVAADPSFGTNILPAIGSVTTLRALDLVMPLDPAVVRPLEQSLRACTAVTKLRVRSLLSSTNLYQVLAASNHCRLTRLEMCAPCTDMPAHATSSFAALFGKMVHLRDLTVSLSHAWYANMPAFLSSLRTLPSLRALSITECPDALDSDRLQCLIDCFDSLADKVRSVTLEGCRLDADELNMLALYFPTWARLQSLSLDVHNELPTDFLLGLLHLNSLEELRIFHDSPRIEVSETDLEMVSGALKGGTFKAIKCARKEARDPAARDRLFVHGAF